MRITIIADDNMVYVDGVAKRVDLSDLDPAIHAIQYDSDTMAGHIEYKRSALVEAETRDHEAETREAASAGTDRERHAALTVKTRRIAVPRGNDRLVSFEKFERYVQRWQEAK